MLKKEFKRKDVERMRNLIRGKADTSSETQVGYKKKRKDYKEGDVWKEGRKTWTIKDGIKQTVSKLDTIKEEVFMPLCCPNCGKVMKSRLDKPNYRIHKKCFNCVIDYEAKLKLRGEYDQYIKKLKAKNNITILEDVESYLLDAVNNASNSSYVSEHGTVEKWVGGINKKQYTKDLTQVTKKIRKKLRKEIND